MKSEQTKQRVWNRGREKEIGTRRGPQEELWPTRPNRLRKKERRKRDERRRSRHEAWSTVGVGEHTEVKRVQLYSARASQPFLFFLPSIIDDVLVPSRYFYHETDPFLSFLRSSRNTWNRPEIHFFIFQKKSSDTWLFHRREDFLRAIT